MDKVWDATMKLTEEVVEMRRALEHIQTTIAERGSKNSYPRNAKPDALKHQASSTSHIKSTVSISITYRCDMRMIIRGVRIFLMLEGIGSR